MPDDDHLDDLHDRLQPDLADPSSSLGEIAPSMLELDKIPRRLWEQALKPLSIGLRFHLARTIPDVQLRQFAMKFVTDLDLAEMRSRRARDVSRHRARRTAAPLPSPDADHAVTRRTTQLNMRLRSDDYERLQEAALAVGMKPTTLARALVLNGVAKVLREGGAT